MNIKEILLTALDTYNDVAQDSDLHPDLIYQGKEYIAKVKNFRVLIPVIGSFNVGKTSLVNAYLHLERDQKLPTDIVPTTALATEIHGVGKDEDERVQIIDKNDHVISELDFESFRKLGQDEANGLPNNAYFAKAFLKSDVINPNRQIVLVDMPGLDSGIQTHNDAIQRYLPLGSYFLLVLDIERGTLRESEILQLREFLNQEIECAVFLNKADRKQTDKNMVKDFFREQLGDTLGKQIPVYTVSALKGELSAFVETFESIDPELAMRNYWRQQIIDLFDVAHISLHTRYNAINFSPSEAEKQIRNLKLDQQKLEEKLITDEQEIRSKYSDLATSKIVHGVRNGIRSKAKELALSYIENGQTGFEIQLNELVRFKLNYLLQIELLQTRHNIKLYYQTNIDGLKSKINDVVDDEPKFSFKAGENFFRAIRNAAEKSSREFENAAGVMKPGRMKSTYSTIAGVLGAVTSVVTPWLGLIFELVPWVMNLFEKEGQKQEQLKKICLIIENDISPKVASDLRKVISEDYAKLTENELSIMRKSINDQIERVKNNIQKAQSIKEAGELEANKNRENLATAINRLALAKKSVCDA